MKKDPVGALHLDDAEVVAFRCAGGELVGCEGVCDDYREGGRQRERVGVKRGVEGEVEEGFGEAQG